MKKTGISIRRAGVVKSSALFFLKREPSQPIHATQDSPNIKAVTTQGSVLGEITIG